MELTRLLEAMLEHGGSDLHLQSGSAPMLRRGGRLQALDNPPLTDDEIRELLPQIAPGDAQVRLESDRSADSSRALDPKIYTCGYGHDFPLLFGAARR